MMWMDGSSLFQGQSIRASWVSCGKVDAVMSSPRIYLTSRPPLLKRELLCFRRGGVGGGEARYFQFSCPTTDFAQASTAARRGPSMSRKMS